MTAEPARGEVLWTPPADAWAATRLARFAAATRPDLVGDHRGLHRWSVEDLEGFWAGVSDHLDVPWRTPPERVLAGGDTSMPGARWFPGGRLSYVDAALRRATEAPGEVAVIARSQTRDRTTMTWAELADAVARCRTGLADLGVGVGDRVAAYAPNIPETLVAFLATASLGAVWCSCAPEFGVRSVVDRLGQLRPSVLLAVDGYVYGTRRVERSAEVAAIVEAVPSIAHRIDIPYLSSSTDDGWGRLLGAGRGAGPDGTVETEAVAADHPLYVLFSSGTTGLPKPIVHADGGITVEHLKVLALHHDLGPGDRFAWFTTTGWMMWNYLVSGLLTGSTVVLFDGDPGSPDLGGLWRLAAEEGVQVLGVSPSFLAACERDGLAPGPDAGLDLSALRQVGSTGAPLPASGFRWVHDAVGPQVQVASVSGGTDVCTAFLGTSPVQEVRAGEISGPLLGCDVAAVGPAGEVLPPGHVGELVLRRPLPSMPVGFWGDVDGSRMRAAYFEDHPGVWTHGDWITFFDDGACVVSGRSDATLNRGGVRLGTADFYAVVEARPEVADSLVVHLDGGPLAGELVLFVALVDGPAALTDDVRASIAADLRRELSPRHAPDRIAAIRAVPRTLSGKKLEVPVKRLLQGAPLDDVVATGALADASALDDVVAFAAGLGGP